MDSFTTVCIKLKVKIYKINKKILQHTCSFTDNYGILIGIPKQDYID